MYNDSGLYLTHFKKDMENDFLKCFPNSSPITVNFENDPISNSSSWADAVKVTGLVGSLPLFTVLIAKLNSNCGVAIIDRLEVLLMERRRQGIATWLFRYMPKMLAKMGFTLGLASTTDSHETGCSISKLLLKCDWTVLPCGFMNPNTKEQVKMWKLKLPEHQKKDVPSQNAGGI